MTTEQPEGLRRVRAFTGVLAAIGGCALLLLGSARAPAAARVRHYVFFNRARDRITEPSFLETKAFEGAQLKYSWRELERGRDGYDFGDIEHDLAFLQTKGKKLFIQVQDISYDISVVPVPRYLLSDPQYNGGVEKQYAVEGDDDARATPEGWVARRWDPAVRDRFQRLLAALGKTFDGRIEGINLAETAIDFGNTGRLYPKGFSGDVYRDAVLSNMAALKRAFPKSVVMVYANFMVGSGRPGDAQRDLRAVYQQARELKVGMGGPDLLPYKPGQMGNSYPLLRESAGRIPTGIAVQDGNYQYKNPTTGKQVTISQLISFATDYLNVEYIFWCTQEPYYSRDVMPVLQSKG